MTILYLISKILTYPGAYMKGFWEHCTCRILRLQVTDRRYLRADQTCGHVLHAPAMSPAKAFLLSWLPNLAQSLLGWIFLGASVGPLLIFGLRGQNETSLFVLEAVALFLGISLVCNAFPQWDDAKRHWRLFYGKLTPEEELLAQALVYEAEAVSAEEAQGEDDAPAEEDILAEEPAAAENVLADEEPQAAQPGGEIAKAMAEVAAEQICEAAEDEDSSEQELAEPAPTEIPRFAGLAGKIIFAPANVYFMAGAWLERCGITTYLSFAAAIALLIIRS